MLAVGIAIGFFLGVLVMHVISCKHGKRHRSLVSETHPDDFVLYGRVEQRGRRMEY